MATLIIPVPLSYTPYSKEFTLVGDGVEGTRTITQLLGDLAPGPLRDVLARAPSTTIVNFNVDQARGSEIRIYNCSTVPIDATYVRGGPCRVRWYSGADANNSGLACLVAAGNVLTVEIRFNHSTQA